MTAANLSVRTHSLRMPKRSEHLAETLILNRKPDNFCRKLHLGDQKAAVRVFGSLTRLARITDVCLQDIPSNFKITHHILPFSKMLGRADKKAVKMFCVAGRLQESVVQDFLAWTNCGVFPCQRLVFCLHRNKTSPIAGTHLAQSQGSEL